VRRKDKMGTTPVYEIQDPGHAGAIDVTRSGVVMLVSAAAETRTVARPARVGLKIALFFLTDGGDCVVTFASAINAAGNTIVTHDTAGDCVYFTSVRTSATAFGWRLEANPESTPLS
jgi:hypothetical protein